MGLRLEARCVWESGCLIMWLIEPVEHPDMLRAMGGVGAKAGAVGWRERVWCGGRGGACYNGVEMRI